MNTGCYRGFWVVVMVGLIGSMVQAQGPTEKANVKFIWMDVPLSLPEPAGVKVRQFNFLGVSMLSPEQLQAQAAPFLNRRLQQVDLDRLCQELSSVYQHTGREVVVYVPRQPLTSDTLMIQVIERPPGEMLPP